MPAIVSYRSVTGFGAPISEYFEYGSEASDHVSGLLAKGSGAQHVIYTWHTTCRDNELTQLLNDVIADAKPTWSEMVDHWVWYCLEGCAYYSDSETRYRNNERYEIVHEMLGVQRKDERSKAQVKLGEQVLHAMQDFGIAVPQ